MNLSIIVPVYNAEKYINECLNSILLPIKNEHDIEVIIVNDGSKDKTEEIIKKYRSEKIKLFNNENKGVSYSRNYGINKASGNFIMFVDADDILSEDWYNIVQRNMEKNNDIIYFSKKLPIKSSKKEIVSYIIGNNEKDICMAGPCSKIFKKSYIEKNNIIFNSKLINGEDMLFNLEAILKTDRFKIVSKSFYKYRLIGNTATKRFNAKIIETDKLFQKEIDKILKQNCTDKVLEEKIKDFCLANGVITILDRLSYARNYKEIKLYLKILNEEPYNKFKYNVDNLEKWKKIILLLKHINANYLVYEILKMKNKRKYIDNSEIIDI